MAQESGVRVVYKDGVNLEKGGNGLDSSGNGGSLLCCVEASRGKLLQPAEVSRGKYLSLNLIKHYLNIY